MRLIKRLIWVSLLIPFLGFTQETAEKARKAIKEKQVTGTVQNNSELLLRGPYLQIATPSSMTVRWRTAVFDRSRVKYGLTKDNLNMSVDDSTLTSEHIVKLSNLKPFTKYYYSIGNNAGVTLQGDENNYFQTLPEKGKTGFYRIAAFGDCGNNSINQRNVRDQVLKYLGDMDLNAWILLGDNAYTHGTDAEYQAKFFNIYKEDMLKKFPLFPSPGNHDYRDIALSSSSDQNKIAYYQNFSVPSNGENGGVPSNTKAYYSFDIGNVHFLSLDSYGKDNNGKRIYDEEGQQIEWVKKDLQANTNKEWIVAYWHHPPYTMGSHNSDTETELVKIRENFIKVLEDNGVDLVICGHSHVYERTKLIKGYFGMEADYNSKKHEISSSTALYDGSKNSIPYLKSSKSKSGTVYVVSGSSGALGGHKESYPHNAMYYSNNEIGGALMMEVEGNILNVKWICADGQIRDHFTMMKDVSIGDEKILRQGKKLGAY
jgi:hypothetical protein